MNTKNGTQPVLSVQNVTKTFYRRPSWFSLKQEATTAVNHISFDLNCGEILGFLGVNGSGKTTTIQMLLDVLTPTAGTISYFGKSLAGHRQEIMQQVTYATAYAELIGNMTIGENLAFYGNLYGMEQKFMKERIEHLIEAFGLIDMRSALARELSAGQMTRAMLARAFLPQPKIILLDEPTASIDPEGAHIIRNFILRQQQEECVSILFTSHNMDEVAEICDRVLVLQKGTIIAQGTPEELAARIATSRVWLIVSHENQALERLLTYTRHIGLSTEVTGQTVSLAIGEHEIAQFLHALAEQQIHYTNISIEKPRLEDYFLQVAQAKRSELL